MLGRLNGQRLPPALELKKRVDAGGKLEDGDIAFLHRVFEDANDVRGVIAKYPEYEKLVAQLISLIPKSPGRRSRTKRNREGDAMKKKTANGEKKTTEPEKLKRKAYEEDLRRLHAELVKLQWSPTIS
jgi:hypothetical protein